VTYQLGLSLFFSKTCLSNLANKEQDALLRGSFSVSFAELSRLQEWSLLLKEGGQDKD
jgi:hypothetical protein